MSLFSPGKKVLQCFFSEPLLRLVCICLSLSLSADNPKQKYKAHLPAETYLHNTYNLHPTSYILHPASYNLYTSYKNNPRVEIQYTLYTFID